MALTDTNIKHAMLVRKVVEDYFARHPDVGEIPAKDLMPEFIRAGIFVSDHRNGLPIRRLLRYLDKNDGLHLIPQVLAARKKQNTWWYFEKI